MRGFLLCLCVSAVILVVSACGGGGGRGGGGNNSTNTVVQFSVHWGERSRALSGPSSALSMTLKIHAAGVPSGDFLYSVNRDANPSDHTQSFTSGPQAKSGNRTVTATFYAGTDSTGDIVGIATGPMTLQSNGTLSGTISTVGKITSVQILGSQTLEVDETKQLSFTTKDIANNLIAVSPGSALWSVTSGGNQVSFLNGYAKGLAIGTPTIKATVDGISSLSTPISILAGPFQRIVFHRADGLGHYYIWRMDVNGNNKTQITFDVGQVGDRHASVSPDGSQIAFIRMPTGSTGHGNVWVMSSDGSNQAQLTTGDLDDEPTWSPDGTQIAFQRPVATFNQIFKMQANGSGVVQVTQSGDNTQPSWSPDGLKIAFQSNRQPLHGDAIRIIDATGNNDLLLVNGAGQDAYPSWTKDGKVLYQAEGRRGIYRVNADGTGDIELIPFGTWSFMYQTSVSADGTQIACEVDVNPSGGDRDVILFTISGAVIGNLSNSSATDDFHPSFPGSP